MPSTKAASDNAILMQNLDKLHITELGAERIRKNLALDISGVAAVTAWCKEKIATAKHIERQGKNWYAMIEDAIITVNAHSYTIITAHKTKDAVIKNVTPADYPQLETFLYHAIFVPQGVEPPPYSLIYDPEIYVYVDRFGTKPGDHGVMAWAQGKAVGAAWVRIIPAYGHIDDNTPELAISLLPDYRGQGIGTVMMARLFQLLKERGYKQTSLNVQKDNPALRFYQSLGYETVSERVDHAGNEDYTMIKYL